MLEWDAKPIVLDTIMNFWGRSLPGAVALKNSGLGGTLDDQIQGPAASHDIGVDPASRSSRSASTRNASTGTTWRYGP
jgi:hypothetical protein